jgi:hypothetical protein
VAAFASVALLRSLELIDGVCSHGNDLNAIRIWIPMRLTARTILFLALISFAGAAPLRLAAQETDLHAIVERDGTVVLCLARAQLLFADRCAGNGQLTIVQPIQEGEVVWRVVTGTIAIENESPQNPDCALSRAKWNPKDERATSSGKQIRKVDPSWILAALSKQNFIKGEVTENDIDAFALDLDNDGNDEIVVSASNLERVARLNEKTGETYPYFVVGGIMRQDSRLHDAFPTPFYFDQGEYAGATDAIGLVVLKGVVPIAAETGEIALLVSHNNGFAGTQDLIRFRGVVQRIETIERRCD